MRPDDQLSEYVEAVYDEIHALAKWWGVETEWAEDLLTAVAANLADLDEARAYMIARITRAAERSADLYDFHKRALPGVPVMPSNWKHAAADRDAEEERERVREAMRRQRRSTDTYRRTPR